MRQPPSSTDSASRYQRQERFEPIGLDGQSRINGSQVLICGCGALGSVIAERLVRSGVGRVRLVDRDWVEVSNLQRQSLFSERHAAEAIPKAIAAAEELGKINSTIDIQAVVDDVTSANIQALAEGCDLIMDGTDNFETRFLINDFCIRNQVPWVHGGCLGASGQVMTIYPGQTACFRCLVPELPPPEMIQTCDTAGVLGPAVGLIACWQSAEALKILSGRQDSICRKLIVVDSWETECRMVELKAAKGCPTCDLGDFPFLEGRIRTESVVLCGKNAVQIVLPSDRSSPMELKSLADRFRILGEVQENAFFVRLRLPNHQITVFPGGRTVVEGTTSPAEAKSLLARTLGS
jgi:molybdopterin-synthase adenylyltransferase